MNLVPSRGKILIKTLLEEAKTESGLIIPDATIDGKLHARGEVVAVGTDKIEYGAEIPSGVKVGDKVYYAQYSGVEIKEGDEKYYIVSFDDVHGVFKSQEEVEYIPES